MAMGDIAVWFIQFYRMVRIFPPLFSIYFLNKPETEIVDQVEGNDKVENN